MLGSAASLQLTRPVVVSSTRPSPVAPSSLAVYGSSDDAFTVLQLSGWDPSGGAVVASVVRFPAHGRLYLCDVSPDGTVLGPVGDPLALASPDTRADLCAVFVAGSAGLTGWAVDRVVYHVRNAGVGGWSCLHACDDGTLAVGFGWLSRVVAVDRAGFPSPSWCLAFFYVSTPFLCATFARLCVMWVEFVCVWCVLWGRYASC